MAIVNVNMGEIKERQPLAAPGPYTFSFRKAELRPTKDGSGYLIYAELTPEGHGTDTIIHRWSLKPGALESRAPSISLKKFFEVMGRADLATASDGFDTGGKSIVSTIRHGKFGNVDVRLAVSMIVGTTIGMELGAQLVMYLEKIGLAESYIRKAYVVFLALIGSYVLYDYLSHTMRAKRPGGGGEPKATIAQELQRLNLPPMIEFKARGVEIPKITDFRYEDTRPGGWDPDARMKDQDLDGVSGEVIYPGVGLFVCETPDAEYETVVCRTFNDWLAEFCAAHPTRLKG